MKKFDPIIYVEKDKHKIPLDIGNWGIKKYTLFGHYCDIFTSGMKNKWDSLIYIDLFACAGLAKIKDENIYLKTSALIAASLPNKFSKYIVSEENEEYLNALRARVTEYHLHEAGKFEFVLGDCNKNVDKIINLIPNGYKTLNFCFVDPYNFDIEFETVKKLASSRKIDFLILFATHMAGNRNYHNYIKSDNIAIEKFINKKDWRTPFLNGEIPQKDFIKYLADCYDKNMQSIGYTVDPNLKFKIESSSNTPLYYLAFYSKSDVGNDFYKKVEKYQSPQGKLF